MSSIVESLQEALRLQQSGRWQQAERLYQQVLARNPNHPDALHLMGVLAAQTGRLELAAALIARAIGANPRAPAYHNNLGNVLQEQGRLAESLLCYREALRQDPSYAEALVNLGNALNKLDRFPEALQCYLKAQRLRPDWPAVYVNLASALVDEGMLDEALACVEEALRLEPRNAEAHLVRARVWLLKGDLERGLAEYEWRWELKQRRQFAQPLWDGQPLDGRTILLWAEQGLGGTIQFVRFAKDVKQAGGRVIVECQRSLAPLVAAMGCVDQVVAQGEELPPCDCHAPLTSLPHILGVTLASLPSQVPYLKAPQPGPGWPALPGEGTLRVGLAWGRNPSHNNHHKHTMALADFALLAGLEGITLVSLQMGLTPAELAAAPAGLRLETLAEQWLKLPGLAAAIARMDLVITADTMHAHLAGALGRPTWVLLAFSPDWPWMRDRTDSPWYPTVRLFRQPRRGDWARVVAEVRDALRQWAAKGAPSNGVPG